MARLTYGERKHMSKSEFAVPSKREGGKGGYPINDEAHARNALSRVSQFGSPAEKAEVRAKVHSKYPGIGKSDGGHGAQPEMRGSAKASHRVEENAADQRMHSSSANHKAEHNDNGMIKAMHAHADKMHPVK